MAPRDDVVERMKTELALKIDAYRVDSQMSLNDFAEAAGLTQSDASNLKNGNLSVFGLQRLIKVATRFGLQPSISVKKENNSNLKIPGVKKRAHG